MSLNHVIVFQVSAIAIRASVVLAHVSLTFVTIMDVNPVLGIGIVLLTVVKAAIVEPVIGGTDIAHHVRVDIMVHRVQCIVMITV